MKKLYFLAAACILLSATGIRAQDIAHQESKIRIGLKAGLNISSLSFDSNGRKSIESGSKAGLMGGVMIAFPIAKGWEILASPEFAMKGHKLTLTNGNELKTNANYVQLPIEAGYRLSIGKQRKWNVEPVFGFFAAYGVSGKYSVSGLSRKQKTFKTKLLKDFDAGLSMGCYFDNNEIVVGVHGDLGLTKVNGSNLRVTNATVHSSNVTFMVGYLF